MALENPMTRRRDSKHRVLRSGESVRADGKYQFKYTVNGKPKFVYSWKLEPTDKLPQGKRPCLSLRELEKQIGYDLELRIDPTKKNMTVMELVEKYLSTRTGMRPNTLTNYKFVKNLLVKEEFSQWKIGEVKTSDAKLFLIKMQNDGRRHSSIKSVRGVLRPAFQMAVDDDCLNKNPFAFALVGVVVNDAVTREAITKKQMNSFLKFIHDDNCYCKYYEVVYILFHTGLRISEFCGLTLKDVDLKNKTINVDHQLQRTSNMKYVIEKTKTNAGTRVLPMNDDVAKCFQTIIEEREAPKVEKMVDGYSGFLFLDKDGMPLVAMHWEHRLNHRTELWKGRFLHMTLMPESGKKIVILYILQILRKYTDSNHTMTQQQIVERIQSDYGLNVNRTTVKSNIEELIRAGYDIQYTEIKRKSLNKKTGEEEENSIYTDLYYQHDFTEAELHMLIDGLLFSRSVPYKQRKQLIDKLGKLSSSWFNQRMNHMHCMSADSPQNKELFLTIEVLDEAITNGKQVALNYGHFGRDLKLHPGLNEDGTIKRQIINPYQMVAAEGRYYLICNNDKYDNAANYRIDRIMSIELLDSDVKPKKDVKGLEKGLNLQEYMYQNLNMFTSPPVNVEFRIPEKYISLVIDFFGEHVSFHNTRQKGTISCRLKVSKEAMKHWAVEHANIVRVVSPASLVDAVREEVSKAAEMYDLV